MKTDIDYMKLAINEAKKAQRRDEVPVGAIIVRGEEIVAKAYNTREYGKNALYHAEIKAIDKACKRLGGWRLVGCTMYVTLEPCPMCAMAMIHSRISKLYFGAYDEKTGAGGSRVNIFEKDLFNHNIEVEGGVMKEECGALLTEFFKNKRKQMKEKKAQNPLA